MKVRQQWRQIKHDCNCTHVESNRGYPWMASCPKLSRVLSLHCPTTLVLCWVCPYYHDDIFCNHIHMHVLTYWVITICPQVLLKRTCQTRPSLKKRNPLTSSKLTLLQSCAKTLVPQWYDNPPSRDTIPAIAVSGRPPDLVTSPPLRAPSQSRYSRPLMWV